MTLNEIAALIRGIVSLWVFASAISVYQLYVDGYRIAQKESKIIRSLTRLIFCMGVMFGYFAVSSLAQAFNTKYHEIIVLFVPIVFFPMGLCLNNFRRQSTLENNQNVSVSKLKKSESV